MQRPRTQMKTATHCRTVLKSRPQIPSKWPYRVRTGLYLWARITVKTNPQARCGTARVVRVASRRVGWRFGGRWLNCAVMWVDTDWFGTTIKTKTEMKCFYLAMQMGTKYGLCQSGKYQRRSSIVHLRYYNVEILHRSIVSTPKHLLIIRWSFGCT